MRRLPGLTVLGLEATKASSDVLRAGSPAPAVDRGAGVFPAALKAALSAWVDNAPHDTPHLVSRRSRAIPLGRGVGAGGST